MGVIQLAGIISILIGLSMGYPYPYPEESAVYDDRAYLPIRRIPRAPAQIPQARRPKAVILMPEGIEMSGTDQYIPRADFIQGAGSHKDHMTAETGYGHSSHPHDYVDYGAYTGGYGAFGWYSDHPVHTYGGYH